MSKEKKSLIVMIAVVILIVTVTASIFYVATPERESVQNVFADINGDGAVDLILNATVVMNDGSNNFPQPPSQELTQN